MGERTETRNETVVIMANQSDERKAQIEREFRMFQQSRGRSGVTHRDVADFALLREGKLRRELERERRSIPQEFMDQLRDALKAPTDRIWFGCGLLTVARVMAERKEAAEASVKELRKEKERLVREYNALLRSYETKCRKCGAPEDHPVHIVEVGHKYEPEAKAE